MCGLVPPRVLAAPRERGWTHAVDDAVNQVRGCPARAGMDPYPGSFVVLIFWLPRASGDGPAHGAIGVRCLGAAPRERGWTRERAGSRDDSLGCPARAGMDPGRRCRRGLSSWLPRASGDGPAADRSRQGRRRAAPRERGWTRIQGGARDGEAGCPARAGMDPSPARRTTAPWRLPRASGDGPRVGDAQPLHSVAAPRERGWTLPVVLPLSDVRCCPARAGMDPLSAAAAVSSSWLPRASGDGPPSPMLCPRS